MLVLANGQLSGSRPGSRSAQAVVSDCYRGQRRHADNEARCHDPFPHSSRFANGHIASLTGGTRIGLCVRIAHYSPVSRARSRRRQDRSPLVRARYWCWHRSADHRRVQLARPAFDTAACRGFAGVTPPLRRLVQPQEVASRVSSCRILGHRHHLAVFALSQGIPSRPVVVGILR